MSIDQSAEDEGNQSENRGKSFFDSLSDEEKTEFIQQLVADLQPTLHEQLKENISPELERNLYEELNKWIKHRIWYGVIILGISGFLGIEAIAYSVIHFSVGDQMSTVIGGLIEPVVNVHADAKVTQKRFEDAADEAEKTQDKAEQKQEELATSVREAGELLSKLTVTNAELNDLKLSTESFFEQLRITSRSLTLISPKFVESERPKDPLLPSSPFDLPLIGSDPVAVPVRE